jgi:[ribosomal protein S5]-alanine N-acetyltransferase
MTNDQLNIRTGRLWLRPFRPGDQENVFKGLSHPDVIQYYGVNFKTLKDTQAQMDFFRDLEENNTGRWWAIVSPDDSIFYGAGGVNSWNHEHHKAEIGFWLLPEFWGKGIMTEAMPLIEVHAFNVMGIHRLEGFVESKNTLCKKAMQKLKYSHEGTMADCEIKNGRYISLDIYAKLNPADNSEKV